MHELVRVPLQAACYATFAAVTVWFASQPVYLAGDDEMAVVKLSVSHATALAEPCRPLTREEIERLAANMRRSESCGRKRVPLVLEMALDGDVVVRETAIPSGLWDDGPASVYRRFDVQPGVHRLTLRMRDSGRTSGWDHAIEKPVELRPGRYFTVTFRAEAGEFRLR